jgi:hypothetical protein
MAQRDCDRLPSERSANPRRTRLAVIFWVLGLAFTCLLAWQTAAGGPVKMRRSISPPPPGAVTQMRLPEGCPTGPWHRAGIRVFADDIPLRQHASRDALAAASSDGYVVHGKSLYVVRASHFENHVSDWKIEFPWIPPRVLVIAVATVWLGWSLLLLWARHPVAIGAKRRIGAWMARSGPPWAALGLAGAAIAGAVAIRIFGFSFPNWSNDAPTHYRAVFAVAIGGPLEATPDRPFGLPLVMGSLLRLVPDLRAVVAAQGVATLLAAGAVGAVIWWSACRLFESAPARAAGRVLGVATFAAIAFNEAVLQGEWALLAESWVAAYLGIQLALVWRLAARPHSLGWAATVFGFLCIAGLLAFFTRPNWGFALAALPGVWAAVAVQRSRGCKLAAWLCAGAMVFGAVSVAAFAFQRAHGRHQGAATLQERARALVCWHVPLVRPEIERRIAADPRDPFQPALREMGQLMDQELARARVSGPGYYPSLGYDADHLYFDALPTAPQFRQLTLEQRTALCSGLFRGALVRRPWAYAGKVLRQLPRLFSQPYDRPRISRNPWLPRAASRGSRRASQRPTRRRSGGRRRISRRNGPRERGLR